MIINLLNNDYKILKNYILNSNLLFVPILGASNSGKSSFIKQNEQTISINKSLYYKFEIKN